MIKTLLAIFITLIVFNSFIGAKIEQPKKTTAVIGVLAFRSKNFEIIHSMGGFPQALLTPFYPEWPFSAAKKTIHFLANKVAVALLNLPYGSEVTKNAGYYGWNIPLSYEGIRSMMQELWVKPYDTIPTFSLKDVIARYAHSIIFSLTLIILLLMGFISKMRHLIHSLRSKSTSLEEQMAIMQEHEKSLRRAAGVFHNSQEGIVITEPQKRIIEVNEAFCQVTGYAREEVLGKKPIILRSGVHDKEFYDQLDESINTTGTWRGEIWNKKKKRRALCRIFANRCNSGSKSQCRKLHRDF